ncbi:MAG TPA: glycerophosphodiester phosphodiesterase [Longimicrobiales bacterium]
MIRKPIHPVLQGGPLLIAHRGGRALMPENTLAAFLEAAARWQADMIEMDVRASADGHCVVIHDATVDRTTDGRGNVAHMTLEQLQSLDAAYHFTRDQGRTFPLRGQGIRIPTVQEVLAALPEMRLTIELKEAAAQRPLFRAIEEYRATTRVIAAGERNAFRTLMSTYPGPKSASLEESLPFFFMHRLFLGGAFRVPADVVQTCEIYRGWRIVTPRFVRDLHRQGLHVHVWTVNEVADMNRLLDWGVDGLVTDYPDRLAEVLHRRFQRPLPPALQPST